MSQLAALNLRGWIEENRHLLKPPVGNKYLYRGQDFFVMVVGGPNARNDFHITDSEEFFYQVEGDIILQTREDGKIYDHRLREGDTFFIPPNVPHSPQRPPNTLGIVVERVRPPEEMEHIVFYCDKCGELVCDIEFACSDIVDHFRDTMESFWKDDDRRLCKNCGTSVAKPGPMAPLPTE
jgi:3-hydroxyanthranilate 3,4-dioxygenase